MDINFLTIVVISLINEVNTVETLETFFLHHLFLVNEDDFFSSINIVEIKMKYSCYH